MKGLMLVLGVALVALAVGLISLAAPNADALPDHGACGDGVVSIVGGDDIIIYDASPDIITGVCIKSGVNMWGGAHSDLLGNGIVYVNDQECYAIKGVGTSTVGVTRTGEGRECQGLSHIDVLVAPPECEEEPCTTPTPTVTPTPSPTPTPSSTPTPTPTPTCIGQTNPTCTSGTPLGFPSIGGEGSDGGSCRDWTTGQAGDVVQPCSDDGVSIWWAILISLFAGLGAAALLTVVLYYWVGRHKK